MDPDHTRPSTVDPEIREVRARATSIGIVEIVVDTLDGRVVTVYVRGAWLR